MSTQADLFGEVVAPQSAMGSHQSATDGSDTWLTPPWLLARLGGFDLDPCASSPRPWPTARVHYSAEDDGLGRDWRGRVWLNPPYSEASRWVERLAGHGNGLALLFARTETRLWHRHVWPLASGLLFLRGRLHFCGPGGRAAAGNAGAPNALIAYGKADAAILAGLVDLGAYVPLVVTS